jgi:hypothetical protein
VSFIVIVARGSTGLTGYRFPGALINGSKYAIYILSSSLNPILFISCIIWISNFTSMQMPNYFGARFTRASITPILTLLWMIEISNSILLILMIIFCIIKFLWITFISFVNIHYIYYYRNLHIIYNLKFDISSLILSISLLLFINTKILNFISLLNHIIFIFIIFKDLIRYNFGNFYITYYSSIIIIILSETLLFISYFWTILSSLLSIKLYILSSDSTLLSNSTLHLNISTQLFWPNFCFLTSGLVPTL